MTAREAFRQWCRLAKEYVRLERRDPGNGDWRDAAARLSDSFWDWMGDREQELGAELWRRLRGARPWERMWP